MTLLARKLGRFNQQSEPLLRAAQARHPEDFWLNYALGDALQGAKPAEAVGFYRAALAVRPAVSNVYIGFGVALFNLGRPDEAIRAYRKAIELDPRGAALPRYNLGVVLLSKGRLDEALTEFRSAVDLNPKDVDAHDQLGMVLSRKGQFDEAMVEYRRAVDLDPKDVVAHHELGMALHRKGQIDEAVVEYRRVIELDPKGASAHHNLGMCWQAEGRLDEAMAEYRRAIDLDPKWGAGHFQLGRCWQARGELDEAMAEYRRAVELDPKGAPAHHQLGLCWKARGELDAAIDEYGRAAELDPGGGLAHESLADTLLRSGRFTEVRAAVRRAFDLLSAQDSHRPALHEKLILCERMLALDARLPALLRGKERPAVEEQLKLAHLCQEYGRPHAAASLYAAVFAARPALADDLGRGIRYNAARAALRAATGQGFARGQLNEAERADLRRRALVWLRADLTLGTKLLSDGKGIVWSLAAWQRNLDLACVRDPAALAKLADSEREEWRRLWTDVAALLAADPLEQGKIHAARHDWAQAAACYARVTTGGRADDGHIWFEYAALLLLRGDSAGYVRVCARMVERCGKDGGLRSYHVARACTLAPDAVSDAPLPGRLAEKELQGSGQAFWSLTEQGALAYRAGRFQQAVPFFEQSLRADPKPGRAVLNWLWLALANQHLGKAEEARRWLEKAQACLDQHRDGMPARAEEEFGLHYHNWLEAHVLCREAEARIPSTVPRTGKEDQASGASQK